MFRRFFIIAGLILGFTALGHGDKNLHQIKGFISNDQGEAISGAQIRLEKNGKLIRSVSSDREGRFTLNIGELNLSRVTIKVSKKGFQSEEIIPAECSKMSLQISLSPKSPEVVPIFRPMKSQISI